MRHYCSLWDSSRYMSMGLALYESLRRHSSEPFTLHVLALDQECYQTLRTLRLPDVELIPIDFFEWQMDLLEVRNNRTWQEYCWTCASQLCEFLMIKTERLGIEEIVYLDADVYLFSSPAPVFAEIGKRSIGITPHQFIPSKQHLVVNGVYNVGFVYFRNTQAGRACLEQWAAQVRDRCSAVVGCGDQLYLNSFPVEFTNECCVIRSNVNIGPWSLANWQVTEGPLLDGLPLIAYHFHETRFNEDGSVHLTNYELRNADRDFIYSPYIEACNASLARIAECRGDSDDKACAQRYRSVQPIQ